MGLFEKIFKKPAAPAEVTNYFKTLTAYQPAFTSWNGALHESELVRSAIDARARHASKLNVVVTGSAQPKLQARIRLQPNQYMTWSQFMYRLCTILDMQNTAFIVPTVSPLNPNQIDGYFPVLPSTCEIVQDGNGNPWLRYRFSSGQTAAIEYNRCGIMTKHQYKSDMFGDRNTMLNDTMRLIDIQTQGITEAVKSSASYRFMARVNNFTKPDDLAKERKRFTAENFSKDGGGLLLFPNTYADIQQIKSSPYTVDAEQIKIIHTNVYNYFGVNEKILQNAAIGDEWNAFYEGAIEPFAVQFSEVMTKMSFTDRERAQGSIIMATSNRLQYMSNKDKLEVSSQMADRGIMTVNEIREIWNLAPVPNGDIAIARGEYHETNWHNDEEQPAEEVQKNANEE